MTLTPSQLGELREEIGRVERNRDMWKSQCELQAATLRQAHGDVRMWKSEAENRSQCMIDLNLDRAAIGVELAIAKETVERLREALTLAANRLDRCAVEIAGTGTEASYRWNEWAIEARTALSGGEA